MPKYGVHMIVLDTTIDKLRASTNPSVRNIGEIMYRNRQAAVLGCIGPDLFFWSPDYEIVRIPYKFYENFKWAIDLYNNTIGKVKEAIDAMGEAAEDVVEKLAPATLELIKKLISEIKETSGLLKSTLSTGLFVGVFEAYDFLTRPWELPSLTHSLFDMFVPPLQNGKNEPGWYWFDMLHYRRTGKFAQNLLRLAGSDEVKLAYAYGYLTHIAADTVGHPFVNQVVGGPYRMHPQRHAACENFIDSWKFHEQYGESINEKLHEKLNLPGSLPAGLPEFLHKAFLDTYPAEEPHPTLINKPEGHLTVKDINTTYEVFRFVSEVLGGMYVKPPEEPFDGVLDVLNDALERFEAPPSPPPSRGVCSIWDILSFGLTERSRECYKNFVEAIGEWLEWLGELIVWTFETILHLLDFLLAALLSLPITVAMAILYGIQLALYSLYRSLRSTLVLVGLLYPEPDELQTSHARNMITPYQCQIAPFKRYPHVHSHTLNNLQCPVETVETPGTAPAWYPHDPSITPNKFISEEPFSLDNVVRYATAKTPQETRQTQGSEAAIGNAIDFATWLISNANVSQTERVVYTDWNLDSDRGYGYKCWRSSQLKLAPPTMVTEEEYV